MGLTRMQARDEYIIGSMAQFLDRNVKKAYDTEVALTSGNVATLNFPKALTIREAKPDNELIVRAAPSIAIAYLTVTGDRCYEVGSAVVWRYRAFSLSCYPSLDSNGAPCSTAHRLLASYMTDAFETEQIKVLDYSNASFSSSNVVFCPYNMEITRVSPPIDRSMTTTLAEEKHRFDMTVSVRYPVQGSLAT